MDIQYAYTKTRSEFGHQCNFSDSDAQLLVDIHPDPSLAADFINPDVCDVAIQCVQELSEHEVNTEPFESKACGINHIEGGWPKEVNPSEREHTIRYRKKVEKDQNYVSTLMKLGNDMEHFIRQNNAIDIYEEYFEKEGVVQEKEVQTSAKIIRMFRDPNKVKRSATSLSWHPDGSQLAVAFSSLEFQKITSDINFDSYIWDVGKPNTPVMAVKPVSPLLSLQNHPSHGQILVGGSHNGQIAYWDTRKGNRPVEMSTIEHSHTDPVFKVIWLPSKTGNHCCSASTDGQILWWDIRNMSKPTEKLVLDPSMKGNLENALGAISLEFDMTRPTRFMVGTVQGLVVSYNLEDEMPSKIAFTYSGHHGSICALQRNPFFPKHFLTVADWKVRIWSEDVPESPIMHTTYHMAYLSDGCWSPVRPSVFFTVRMDGTLDVWDMLSKQNDPTLSLKVCDEGLYSLRVQDNGRYLGCGSQMGTVTLLELSSDLCGLQQNEKALAAEMFEQETKQKTILKARCRETERSNLEQSKAGESKMGEENAEELVARAEKEFYEIVEAELKRSEKEEGENEEDKNIQANLDN